MDSSKVTLHGRQFRVMIPDTEIDKAIQKVADKLNARFSSPDSRPIFIGVLKGSVLFLADLVRKTSFLSEMEFVRISSYEGTSSTGKITLNIPLSADIEGRDVVIVEDIVDTGESINFMLSYLKEKNPRSISVCTLFFKPDKYRYTHPIDYPALTIGNEFIVGYGLDYDQLGRNLKDVYVLDE